MAIKLPEHSHCLHCGDPIPYGKEYCDKKCLLAYRKEAEKTRTKDFIFYATIAVALIAISYMFIF